MSETPTTPTADDQAGADAAAEQAAADEAARVAAEQEAAKTAKAEAKAKAAADKKAAAEAAAAEKAAADAAAAEKAAYDAEVAEKAAAQAAEEEAARIAALNLKDPATEQAELDALAATGNAPHPPAGPIVSVPPVLEVGQFVGYAATCIGGEDGMYAVDPDTGCITGPFEPDQA